jgi:hypothetical protein
VSYGIWYLTPPSTIFKLYRGGNKTTYKICKKKKQKTNQNKPKQKTIVTYVAEMLAKNNYQA